MKHWIPIPKVDLTALTETRKHLHQSVQVVSAVPRNVLPHDPSDTSASLDWSFEFACLESMGFGKQQDYKAGIIFGEFKLVLIKNGSALAKYDLEGHSTNDALSWMKDQLSQQGLDASKVNLDLPYEIEDYDYNTSLEINALAAKAFSCLFGNTFQILQKVKEKFPKAEAIRCWPHHFDIATLIPIERDSNGEVVKSIGIGFSPGDEAVPEPYLYVNSWPVIDRKELIRFELDKGEWVDANWSGATLKYAEMLNDQDGQVSWHFVDKVIGILLEKLNGI
jgi:hypothetical protein